MKKFLCVLGLLALSVGCPVGPPDPGGSGVFSVTVSTRDVEGGWELQDEKIVFGQEVPGPGGAFATFNPASLSYLTFNAMESYVDYYGKDGVKTTLRFSSRPWWQGGVQIPVRATKSDPEMKGLEKDIPPEALLLIPVAILAIVQGAQYNLDTPYYQATWNSGFNLHIPMGPTFEKAVVTAIFEASGNEHEFVFTVLGEESPPAGDFSVQITEPDNGAVLQTNQTYTFSATSQGGTGNVRYLWKFPDNTTKEGQTVTKTFQDEDSGEVEVTAISGDGRQDRDDIFVTVQELEPPAVSIRFIPPSPAAGTTVTAGSVPPTTFKVEVTGKTQRVWVLLPRLNNPLEILEANPNSNGARRELTFNYDFMLNGAPLVTDAAHPTAPLLGSEIYAFAMAENGQRYDVGHFLYVRSNQASKSRVLSYGDYDPLVWCFDPSQPYYPILSP